jgi:Arc/MetJ family transcription regulator
LPLRCRRRHFARLRPDGTPAGRCILRCRVWIYDDDEEERVAKTLVDIDESLLAAAKAVLGTTTKKETVNAALAQAVALAARRRDIERLCAGGLPDLADTTVTSAAWR